MTKLDAPPTGGDDVGASADRTLDRSRYTKDGRLKSALYEVEMERLHEQLVLLEALPVLTPDLEQIRSPLGRHRCRSALSRR